VVGIGKVAAAEDQHDHCRRQVGQPLGLLDHVQFQQEHDGGLHGALLPEA
jgi:hypothetical protein